MDVNMLNKKNKILTVTLGICLIIALILTITATEPTITNTTNVHMVPTITIIPTGVNEPDLIEKTENYIKIKNGVCSCGKNNYLDKHDTIFLNHCGYCKEYNSLLYNPKMVSDGELTCKYCDCDYCTVCGVTKSEDHSYSLIKK